MSGKYALIVANTEYTDSGLAQLTAPGKDAKEFWRVLSSPEICAFDDVLMLLNEDSYRVAENIEIFFDKKRDLATREQMQRERAELERSEPSGRRVVPVVPNDGGIR